MKSVRSSLSQPCLNQDVSVDGTGTRRWLIAAPDCKALEVHRIARVGLDEARHPYQRVRLRPEGSFLMVVLEGAGKVLLEGRWQTLAAGWAAMAPPRVTNAFHALPGRPWHFA